MSLVRIAWRSIQQRRLASALTALSMGLGVALVVAVLVVYAVVKQSFNRGGEGYDLLVGPKGGDLELVLNAAFYLRSPVGSLPDSYYEEFVTGRFAFETETAVPIVMGHNYRDFPVIGTTSDMFDKLTYRDGRKYEFAEGENFKADSLFDAVVGATVARQTGLKVGSTFQARHGVSTGADYDGQPFTVVGVLAHTGTPNDRALFVNREGFYTIHAHHDADADASAQEGADDPEHADAADPEHEADHEHRHARAVSAILVCLSDPTQILTVQREINDGQEAQAVTPSMVISNLFKDIVGDLQLILLLMAVLIVVVAGLGIMVSIYNSMSERRREIAIMRALGAGRVTVMLVILTESILLSLGGGVLGLVLGHGLIGLLAPVIADKTGVVVGLLQFRPVELVLIPGLIVLASLVGYLPAMTAYRTDVARSLTASP